MKIKEGFLTYCTNIHPGNNWDEHFIELQKNVPKVKGQITPDKSMGLGLRVSFQMSEDLKNHQKKEEFTSWLQENDVYVFLINGFPYGQFHHTVIKDKVHHPDWTTPERLLYTQDLFTLLADLLPDEIEEGGISTSPLSYRYWFKDTQSSQDGIVKATGQIVLVAEFLHEMSIRTGKFLHLDVEPEPDGLIEDGAEFIHWYKEILLPTAHRYFSDKGLNTDRIEGIIRTHIRLCYDVCHMAVEFENQKTLIGQLNKYEIPIGRLQLSSALRLPAEAHPALLEPFDEPQYLHQVVIESDEGRLIKYPDLPDALADNLHQDREWRTHFHVPLFTDRYGELRSTIDYVKEILEINKNISLTKNFEIETYTWEVLPKDLQLPISESIARELEFILNII